VWPRAAERFLGDRLDRLQFSKGQTSVPGLTDIDSLTSMTAAFSRLRNRKWTLEPEAATFAPNNKWSNIDMDPVPAHLRTWSSWDFIAYWLSDAGTSIRCLLFCNPADTQYSHSKRGDVSLFGLNANCGR
jgi:hypothetical protein